MTGPRLEVTRAQILAFRRQVGALDRRLPRGRRSLRRAAWAGLQDSMPRAALLSIHARVEGTQPSTWEDPSLVQVWGPRYHVYVVATRDLPLFTLARLPDGGRTRRKAEELAARLDALLDGASMRYDEAGRALGVHGNALRYAALTGTLAIRWEGARLPVVWTVSPPEIDRARATLELARRFVHVFGPATPRGFARWAGIGVRGAVGAFEELAGELVPVWTPVSAAVILGRDEATIREPRAPTTCVRLLPSGDAYTLGITNADRELLVPDAGRRAELWTPRVWPGALLVDGKIVGTWRRAQARMTVRPWQRLSAAARKAVVAEAESLPLPTAAGQMSVDWE